LSNPVIGALPNIRIITVPVLVLDRSRVSSLPHEVDAGSHQPSVVVSRKLGELRVGPELRDIWGIVNLSFAATAVCDVIISQE
jgi:hypothetical protein